MLAMEIEEVEGMFGSHHHFIAPSGMTLGEIPAWFREHLDESEATYLGDPGSALRGMIGRCEHPILKSWLERLQEVGFTGTELTHIREPDIWFVSFRYANGIGISPPKISPVGKVHPTLVPIFSVIGGVLQGSAEFSNYHLHSLPHARFSNMGWIEDVPKIDPDLCHDLVTEPDGNVIGWHETDDRVVYCNHGKLAWSIPLDEFIGLYFDPDPSDEDDDEDD